LQTAADEHQTADDFQLTDTCSDLIFIMNVYCVFW